MLHCIYQWGQNVGNEPSRVIGGEATGYDGFEKALLMDLGKPLNLGGHVAMYYICP